MATIISGIEPRPQTPPHHPIHGVHMPVATIEHIIAQGFPEVKLVSVTQLEPGRSYNNRIYYLKHRRSRSGTEPAHLAESEEHEFVLKVNGRFFGASKIQNEVACLRLLETYCSEVPAPRPLAWSEDGVKMTTRYGPLDKWHTREASTGQEEKIGWIMMTRVPGEPISSLHLEQAAMIDLAQQLADHVTSWRRLVPRQVNCGNIRFCQSEYENFSGDINLEGGPDLVVRGLLSEDIELTQGITSVSQYYRIKLEDKLQLLKSSETYADNRPIAPLVQAFIAQTLPKLILDEYPSRSQDDASPGRFVFTHYDLSPRNILISGEPPRISGIVDFEFSGFFSPLEEFLNDYVGNEGDWPREVYKAYLETLENNGIATPAKSVASLHWKQAYGVEKLVENIAPWWLPGQHQGKELASELKKSEEIVREMLEKLEAASSLSSNDKPWLSTLKLLNYVNRTHGFNYSLTRRLEGGYQGGAYLISIKGGDGDAVIKWNRKKLWAKAVTEAAPVVEQARKAKWPTPKWIAFGDSPSGYPYVIQEYVPHSHAAKGVTGALATAAIDFVETHHSKMDLNTSVDYTTLDRNRIFDEEENLKHAQPLREYSATGAALVDLLISWAEPYRDLIMPSNDLVHGDFQPGNILVADDKDCRIVALIDVEAIGKGSRLHDIANLACHNIIWGEEHEALPILENYARSHGQPGEWEISLTARLFGLVHFAVGMSKRHGRDAEPVLERAIAFVKATQLHTRAL